MNESRERIRREREREKNTYTSPRLALRKVLVLAEGRQFREAAAILSRLPPGVLHSVATELPLELLVDALPHSAHLLETLLNRLVSVEPPSASVGGGGNEARVQCEVVAWRLVSLLGVAREHLPGLRTRTARLAVELARYSPHLRQVIATRRTHLDRAVQGLGSHGLTADASGTLISLHVALKNELQRHTDVYKQALHKLDEMSTVTVNQDPASSSHQRLLAFSHSDVERRLIDNKSLLTIVEKPALRQLTALIASLSSRVENDKEVLSCIGQVKRTDATLDLDDGRPVAGVLMSYSRGCDALLSLMGGEGDSPPASGPAPRSPATDSCSDGYHSDSDASPPRATNKEAPHSHHKDNHIRRNSLISSYGVVFDRAAEETLPALNALEPLQHAPQLKYKIIFSIVVLSFRAAITLRERRLAEMKAALGVVADSTNNATDESLSRLVAAANSVLQQTAHSFPLGEAERTVANQVLSTLREFPCLAGCAPLHSLVARVCRAAWTLSVQDPPLNIDTDFTPVLMRPERHLRFSTSDQRSDLIRSFVWPALLDGQRCVYRAVVIT